jgi:hypothetical protein
MANTDPTPGATPLIFKPHMYKTPPELQAENLNKILAGFNGSITAVTTSVLKCSEYARDAPLPAAKWAGLYVTVARGGVSGSISYLNNPDPETGLKLLNEVEMFLATYAAGEAGAAAGVLAGKALITPLALAGGAAVGAPIVLAIVFGAIAVYIVSDQLAPQLPGFFEWWTSKLESVAALSHRLSAHYYRPRCGIKQKVEASKAIQSAGTKNDPLVLDLNGDGIMTTKITDGVYFDHDENGFAELSAWVSRGDGLLVLDKNGNGQIDSGRELFGGDTLLKDGTLASNGFEALADLDDNFDNIIDSHDTGYADLAVWQDTNSDGHADADELHSLDDFGIRSIRLSVTLDNTLDEQGNLRDGGAGNDRLFGGSDSYWSGSGGTNGNDTYLFDRGYGEDVVVDFDGTAGNLDTIRLGDGLAPADVTLAQEIVMAKNEARCVVAFNRFIQRTPSKEAAYG